MAENLIATTSKVSMNALAWQGIPVYTCFNQIHDAVLRKFGREVALLFAMPVENKAAGEIDWYTPVNGTPRRLVDFPDEEKAPLYAKFAQAAEEILKYADEELIRSGKPERITRGEILKLALRYPDENSLLVVGEQPVMTCWGFGPGTPGAEGFYLAKLAYKPVKTVKPPVDPGVPEEEQPTPPPEEPVKEKEAAVVPVAVRYVWGWGWLWWLFPLLSLLLLFFLFFTTFGSFPAISGVSLFSWQGYPFEGKDYGADISRLKMELATLEGRLEDHVAQCVPKEKGEKTPVAEDEGLVIPEDPTSLDFLEGEWLCRTGLVNAQSGEPVQFSFTFNKDGAGQGVVHESSGDQCVGDARGALREGVLQISLEEQTCRHSGRKYVPLSIQCQNILEKGGTSCRGINQDGSTWEATFHRLR